MTAVTTVLAFLVTLGVLIVVHEWGHYRMARACGVKVLRFSVGFGRTLWRHQRSPDDTEFVVAVLPLGGYVKMLDEREDPVPGADLHMAFNRKPLRQRAAIVAAGPVANLVLAVLLYAVQNWIGIDEPKALLSAPAAGSLAEKAGLRSGDWVRASVPADTLASGGSEIRSMTDLRWQVMQAAIDRDPLVLEISDANGRGLRRVTLDLDRVDRGDVDSSFLSRVVGLPPPYAPPVMGDPVAGGPAARAGLQSGDRVLRVDGEPVLDAHQLRLRIRKLGPEAEARPMTWLVERQGRTLELVVLPRVLGDGAQRIGRIDAIVGKVLPEMVTVRLGLLDGLTRGATLTWEQATLTLKMFGRMIVGEASLKNLSGPITIADYAGQSAERGVSYYLGFLALVSVGLGVLNLLPVPLLDGGHLMYYLFEGLTGRPVSEMWLRWLQRGGALLLMLMMTLALSNDVARLLGLH